MLFAHLKRILKLDRLRLRGPNGVHDEFLLAATAQNLRRMGRCEFRSVLIGQIARSKRRADAPRDLAVMLDDLAQVAPKTILVELLAACARPTAGSRPA